MLLVIAEVEAYLEASGVSLSSGKSLPELVIHHL